MDCLHVAEYESMSDSLMSSSSSSSSVPAYRSLRALQCSVRVCCASSLYSSVQLLVPRDASLQQLLAALPPPLLPLRDKLPALAALLAHLCEHDANHPTDLQTAVRSRQQLQRGLTHYKNSTNASFNVALLLRSASASSPLLLLLDALRSSRAELYADRDAQLRILQDTHSLKLSRVAAAGEDASDDMLADQAMQMSILEGRYVRLLAELADAQRREYADFVAKMTAIELQTPPSVRMQEQMAALKEKEAADKLAAAKPKPSTSTPAAATAAQRRPLSSILGARSAAKLAQEEKQDKQQQQTVAVPVPITVSDGFVTSFCFIAPSGSVHRVCVERLSTMDLVTRRLDLPGLTRAAIVAGEAKPGSLQEKQFSEACMKQPELQFDLCSEQLKKGRQELGEVRDGDVLITRHSNLASVEVFCHILSSALNEPTLSQRRLQTRQLLAALRRSLSLCHVARAATVSVAIGLCSDTEALTAMGEEGPAWNERVTSVAQMMREAALWPYARENSFRTLRFILPAAMDQKAAEECGKQIRMLFLYSK